MQEARDASCAAGFPMSPYAGIYTTPPPPNSRHQTCNRNPLTLTLGVQRNNYFSEAVAQW